MRRCSVPGCEGRHRANGFCNKHHLRNKRHGSPLGGGTYVGDPTKFFLEALAYDGNECLIWPFGTSDGYAKITVHPDTAEHGSFSASRLICEKAHGPPPDPKMDAAHSCGNGAGGCITPRHLRWATRAENVADMAIHGTARSGEQMATAKLKAKDVVAIRFALRDESNSTLARRFGVDQSTISLVRSRRRWKDVF